MAKIQSNNIKEFEFSTFSNSTKYLIKIPIKGI